MRHAQHLMVLLDAFISGLDHGVSFQVPLDPKDDTPNSHDLPSEAQH